MGEVHLIEMPGRRGLQLSLDEHPRGGPACVSHMNILEVGEDPDLQASGCLL